ncbi:MAG: GNAT family N-acetyltransferase [Anaerolineae bacterium]|nr:MAG: GNAT family N-acetyltransferase [Anaerolineae bacterium]
MANIQRARADDVPGIAEVIKTVWNIDIDVPYAQELLSDQKQHAWVAVEAGQVIGFVSSFLNSVMGGVRRWEVDLLAVAPSAWGNGLGQKLIEATTQDARTYHAKFARALVHIDNSPAKRSFEKAGYATSGQIYSMYLWPPQVSYTLQTPSGLVSLTPVDTLTYRGVWVEGLDGNLVSDDDRQACITAARALAARENRNNASALIPTDAHLPENLMTDATLHGQYQWWRRS